jgi:hypothetical protein
MPEFTYIKPYKSFPIRQSPYHPILFGIDTDKVKNQLKERREQTELRILKFNHQRQMRC